MKIVIATPLYPPDIAEPAPYVKELAARISTQHLVTVVTYGALPEKIPGVRIVAVSKRQPLPFRIFEYTFALLRASLKTDIIYSENGASVELPAVIVSTLLRKPLILHIGDRRAHEKAPSSEFLSFIEKLTIRRSQKTLTETPPPRPEILPFVPRPDVELATFESSWASHLQELENIFSYAK